MPPTSYIIDGIRTPVGKLAGALSHVRADDLAAHVIADLAARNPAIPADAYADVILGCANQAGEDNRNVARMALLLAGLPHTVPGETINRLCASGMSALVHAHRAIQTGDGHLFIAGGVEHMTRSPWVMSKSAHPFGRDMSLHDSSFGWRFVNPRMEQLYGIESMGQTAENLAEMYAISREDQDLLALRSQQKAAAARQSGRLTMEIAPVPVPHGKKPPIIVSEDEFIKPDTTLEGLAQLRPAFRPQGSVTAGNASGLNDGAAAVLVASEDAVQKYGLAPKARIVASAVSGVEPRIMGIGPVSASAKALEKAGLHLADMDHIEINEAFAAQVLACTRLMGLSDDDPRINPNGGAIAIGHPLGMSGARIAYSAALELHLRGGRYALVTMCIGVGQGYAMVLERA
jgi:acetyl-CoA acyltransferase